MNLVDQLLKADVKKAKELETGEYQSRRLAKILEAEEKTLPVKIREIKSRRMNDIVSYQFKNNGDMDFSKTYDAALMVCVEGCMEPDLMNKELQSHFGCSSAKELAETLFQAEAKELADAITGLSGITEEDDKEEEVKN